MEAREAVESSTRKSPSRESEPVANVEATADEAVGDETLHSSVATPPVNASQLRDRTHKKRHTIKKLEKKLEVLHRQIKKFNEAEVSLEEMDSGSSAYMKEDLLKRKFVATWQELCKYKRISSEIEISFEELSNGYTNTPYPEINRRVTRLLKHNEFPDHYDIVELIERCSAKHNLGISVEEKAQLSRTVFKDVGKLLKANRARDFKAHFGSHLTDDALKVEDPASKDAELLEILRKSLREGQEKLEQLCEGFVLKQEVETEQEKSTEGDVCETDESAEDDEEEAEVSGAEMLVAEGQDGAEVVEDIEESVDGEENEEIDIELSGDEEKQGEREEMLPSFSESSAESKDASPEPVSTTLLPLGDTVTHKPDPNAVPVEDSASEKPSLTTVSLNGSVADKSDPAATVSLESAVTKNPGPTTIPLDKIVTDRSANEDDDTVSQKIPIKRKLFDSDQESHLRTKVAKVTPSEMTPPRRDKEATPTVAVILLDDEDDDDVIVLSD